jgi:hypothetical protein
LALLPTGELVTSGFDTGRLVIFRPYTEDVRSVGFGGHVEDATVTPKGDLLSFSPESQLVLLWDGMGKARWGFHTLYLPLHGAMLRNGDVLVGVFHQADRACMNAAAAAQRARRPPASYWIWFAAGLGSAILLTALVRRPTRRRIGEILLSGDGSAAAPRATAPGATPVTDKLPSRQRIELALYSGAATAFAAVAALNQERLIGHQLIWRYAALVGIAGLFLALMQGRTPPPVTDWTRRMAFLQPMALPTRRMAVLWSVGILLILASLYGVARKSESWPLGAWSAGLLLLAGGAIQPRAAKVRVRLAAALAGVLGFAALVFIRVYRLEEYPANLHLDMAQWSTQTLRLLDGDVRTVFTNGWAEIPLLGYGWSALWTAIAGRSLAGCRFSSVVGSLVAIAGVFFLVRRLYSTRTAAIAALLLGVNHGFLHFSRIQAYMDPIPFQVLGLLGLVAGLESGTFGWFGLAGLAGGYSALTYHAGRITPPLMVLLGVVLLLRYRQTFRKRWPGLLFGAVVGLATLAPQALVYSRGAGTAFGRLDMYPWLATGKFEAGVLRETLATGLPRSIGSFWIYGDSSTQYGGMHPVFFPPAAALLGMGIAAALLRPRDVRGIWVLVWALVIVVAGGALTRDPPFWPRFVAALVPATIIVAVVLGELCRGLRAVFGRFGPAVALVVAIGFIGTSAWQNIGMYIRYCKGMPANENRVTTVTQWTQGIMGRDLQHWGTSALVYIVARSSMEQSCSHPTMQFFDYDVDVRDAREIDQYLPFKDPRTIVCYFLPEMGDGIAAVRRLYPDAREDAFFNSLGAKVFTRVVVATPHS